MIIDHVYEREASYIVFQSHSSVGWSFSKDSEESEEIEAYLADHPEALVPEPVPPAPTPEQIEAARVAGIKAALDEIDRRSIRALRAGETARLADLEAEAQALRETL